MISRLIRWFKAHLARRSKRTVYRTNVYRVRIVLSPIDEKQGVYYDNDTVTTG